MTPFRRSFAPLLFAGPVAALALLAVGCGGDEVVKYNVPKSTESGRGAPPGDPHAGVPGAPGGPPAPGAPAAGGSYRILGAMYPGGDPSTYWYFKFAGPADQIGAQEANFDALAKSVKFVGGPRALPAFDLPAGWERTGPRDLGVMRFDEVLKVGTVECTISTAGGGGQSNIARWADQVGAPPGGTSEFDANGVKATRVDLRGPKNPVRMGGPPPFAGKRP
jgi:hypothetical protein